MYSSIKEMAPNDSVNRMNISNSNHAINWTSHVSFSVVIFILMLINLLGNGFVLIVSLTKRVPSKQSLGFLIMNLAITDLLRMALCDSTTAITFSFGYWMFGGIFCQIQGFLKGALLNISSFTHTAIAIER